MIKRYSSPAAKITVWVKKDGKVQLIEFPGYDPITKKRTIEVSDPEIQRQFEKSPDFDVRFHLDYIIQEDEQPAQEPEVAENIMPHKDLISAKRWLNSLGIPYFKMKNKDSCIELAKGAGYTLVFENN